ncbi:MAG: AsnC family transcriptional regulator, partial [Mycobacteriales bacterium]
MSEYDAVDRRLLRLLVDDGRRSYTDLAKDTGLSTSAV